MSRPDQYLALVVSVSQLSDKHPFITLLLVAVAELLLLSLGLASQELFRVNKRDP